MTDVSANEPRGHGAARRLRRLLSIPAAYSTFQKGIGAYGARSRFVLEHVRPSPGDRVLDIGCGTGEIVVFLREQRYEGFDPSRVYIEAARAQFGQLGEFSVGSVSDPPPLSGEFDLVISLGVLHHLDDDEAGALVDLAHVQLRSGGRFITLDPVLVEGQHPFARALALRDRGSHVRSPLGYRGLIERRFAVVTTSEHHDYLRVPYSHLAIEAA